MSAADDLRALSAAATPGPWTISHRCIDKTEMDDESCGLGLEIDQWDEPMRGHISLSADARITVWLRNHADAFADLIDAAREVRDDMAAGALDYHVQAANRLSGVRLHEALTALDGTP